MGWAEDEASIKRKLSEIERRTDVLWEQGISDPDLRDRFAMAVAQEVARLHAECLCGQCHTTEGMQIVARTTYDLADALMAERARRRGGDK